MDDLVQGRPEADPNGNVLTLPRSVQQTPKRGRPRKEPSSAAPGSASSPREPVREAIAPSPPPPRRRPGKAAELVRRILDREHLTDILLIVPSCGTMLLTYLGIAEGMAEGGAGAFQKAQAVLFSASIGISIWVVWHWLFGLARFLAGQNLRVVLTAGGISVVGFAVVDAPFNMQGLAGSLAVQLSIADTASSYDARSDSASRQAAMLMQLEPALSVQAQRFDALAKSEIKHGGTTGSPKPGKVSGAFESVGKLLSDMATSLKGSAADVRVLQEAMASELRTLKAQVYQQGPIRGRMEAAAAASDRLDTLFVDLSKHASSVSVRALIDGLERMVPAPTNARTDFERRQNDELRIIAALVRPVADSLRAAVKELDEAPPALTASVRPMPSHQAIRHYWWELLSHWAAAGLLAISPFGLLIILIAAHREYETGDGEEMPHV